MLLSILTNLRMYGEAVAEGKHSRQVQVEKAAAEISRIWFDFTSALLGLPVGDSTIAVRTYSGTDVTPIALGAPIYTGSAVGWMVGGGTAGVTYELKCNGVASSLEPATLLSYLTVTS